MLSRRALFLSLAAVPLLTRLRAQTPAPSKDDKTFSTDVNVVNVYATVRDKKNQTVRDLTQDDFTIDQDGRPQTIKYFSKESNLPLTLGLLVDTSGSMARLIETERSASYKFFDQILREDKDQAFLIHFDHEVELLQDLTNSRKQLQSALAQLAPSASPQLQRRDPQDSGGDPRRRGGYGRQGGGGTQLYDAIYLASNDLMSKQKNRKAVILLTDGDDRGSKTSLTEAISAAQKADTLCYAIRFAGEESSNGFSGLGGRGMGRRGGGRPMGQQRGDGKKVLEQIARETGGGYFEESKKQTLDDIYRQLQDELRNQYSLGYTPDKDTGPGYRALRVLAKKKDLVVQARDGYYASK